MLHFGGDWQAFYWFSSSGNHSPPRVNRVQGSLKVKQGEMGGVIIKLQSFPMPWLAWVQLSLGTFITCTDKSYRTQDNILYLLGRGFIFKQTPHENAKLGHKTSLWRQSNIWALQAFLPNLWWQDNSKDNSTQIPDNRPNSEQKMRNPETSNRDPSSSSSEATQLISNARRLQSKVIAL